MPETCFRIRWPNGAQETCYSPSSVVRDYFRAGESYPLQNFIELSRAALSAASERVREKYGMPCSRAMAQLAQLETASRNFAAEHDPHVIVEAIEN